MLVTVERTSLLKQENVLYVELLTILNKHQLHVLEVLLKVHRVDKTIVVSKSPFDPHFVTNVELWTVIL